MNKAELLNRVNELSNIINVQNTMPTVTEITNADDNSTFNIRLEKLEKAMIAVMEENAALKKEIKVLKKDVCDVDDDLFNLEKEVYSTQQYGRRWNIEIENIPEDVKQDKLGEKVQSILNAIDVNVTQEPFQAVHRLSKPKNSKSPPSVIVRFFDRNHAHKTLKNKKNTKNINKNTLGPSFKKPVFIHESLCPHYKDIFKFVKSRQDTGEVHKVWTFKGIVNFVYTDDEDEIPTKIHHYDQLWDMFDD